MATNNTKCIFANYGTINIIDASSFTWTMDCSFDCKTSGEYITSPEISFGVNNELKWQFELFPRGEKTEFKEYLSLNLKSLNNFYKGLIFSVSINNNKSPPLTIHHNFGSNKIWSDPKFCDKRIVINKTSSSCTIYCKILGTYLEYLSSELWKNKDSCDLTITVAQKKFHVHKAILAAQSSVFQTKFNYVGKTLNIVDIDPNIFEVILEFIYTGKVQNIKKIAQSVLVAADKYALKKLKDICIDEINRNINYQNVIDVLKFADLHNLDVLKESAMYFIISKAKHTFNKQTYDLMQNSLSPSVMMELFRKYVLHFGELTSENRCGEYEDYFGSENSRDPEDNSNSNDYSDFDISD